MACRRVPFKLKWRCLTFQSDGDVVAIGIIPFILQSAAAWTAGAECFHVSLLIPVNF